MARSATLADRFTGFPAELFSFLEGLEADNSKRYWEANKATWKDVVQPTVEALMADLEDEFGPLRTFRPNRDVRFSEDKSPYKTWVGITTSDRAVGGIGAFLRVEASGLRLARGAMAFAPDQVKQFRKALDNPAAARELDKIRQRLARQGLPVGPGKQPVLQRPPQGFSDDHPRAELLRWKGAVVIQEHERAAWMSKPGAIDRIRETWATAAPLQDWIDHHVGSSDTPARRPR
jgi:uncharacterized protein (TIGR02453 family)